MRKTFAYFSFILLLASCGEESKDPQPSEPQTKVMTKEDSLVAKKDSLNIESDYDLSTVPEEGREEFIENLARIEDKYGTQWDFCSCVVKSDSVMKAFATVSDEDMDRLMARSDEIDKKCEAFRVQSASQTPEDRIAHKKKVEKCLKAAGLN